MLKGAPRGEHKKAPFGKPLKQVVFREKFESRPDRRVQALHTKCEGLFKFLRLNARV